MNNDIVKNFTNKMIKKGDMAFALTEAEFGFDKMNMVDTMSNFIEGAARFFKRLFGDKYKDIKFKLDKGYFAEVYNKYNKIKNPTVENLREFKNELLSTLSTTCDYIEKVFNEEIDKIKTEITVDNIKKYLETDEK